MWDESLAGNDELFLVYPSYAIFAQRNKEMPTSTSNDLQGITDMSKVLCTQGGGERSTQVLGDGVYDIDKGVQVTA